MMQPESDTETDLYKAAQRLLERQSEALEQAPALTVTAVSEEVGISRTQIYRRYRDFLDDLEVMQEQSPIITKADLRRVRSKHAAEVRDLKEENRILANRIQALVLEIQRLRSDVEAIPIESRLEDS